MTWFDVDKAGLAATLERRGKFFALSELIANALDSGAKNIRIFLTPITHSPYARLEVHDDSAEGWSDLSHAFTMFAKSKRGADAQKRGRFNLGEKLVLACCRSASILTMNGTIGFNEEGRISRPSQKLERGTIFEGEIRMTRDEIAECASQVMRIIPPDGVSMTFNGEVIERPSLIKSFTVKLPTEIQDDEGSLRRSVRLATVEAFDSNDNGEVLEMGIPIQLTDWPWRLNVLQKVPLGMDRDAVTDGFRRALQVAAINALSDNIPDEDVSRPWVQESIADGRIEPIALKTVFHKQFGERVVSATPGDPIANAQAEAHGCTVIHGGALSSGAWSNLRKHNLITPASAAYPTMKPEDKAKIMKSLEGKCPLCGNQLPQG